MSVRDPLEGAEPAPSLHRFNSDVTDVKRLIGTVEDMRQRAFSKASYVTLFVGATLVVVMAGCGAGEPSAGGDVIAIDGSSTVFPITEAVAEEFQMASPGARVTVGISGTGGGFSKFCAGEIDISDASRPIKPVEVEACAAAGIGFVELPVAYDGIAIVVNPENDWVDTLTIADLRRMWEPAAQGTVTRWEHVRTGWPEDDLHLFGPGADSGTFDYFSEAIVGEEGASRGDFTSSEDDNVLVQGISRDALGLGFFGYAYYEENRDRLKLIPVDDGDDSNGAGPIAASPDTVRDGTYQPLSRPIFVYVSTASLERPEVQAFVDFYLTEGADLVREVGYVPLSPHEYALVAQRANERVVGSMFGGGQEVGSSLEVLLAASTQP